LKQRIQFGKQRLFQLDKSCYFKELIIRGGTAKAEKLREGGILTGNWRPLEIGSEVLL